MTDAALLRLLHLASPALPIGAFAYSQGLEHAVTAGWVRDENETAAWILGVLEYGLGHLEIPVLARLIAEAQSGNQLGFRRWNDFLFASRGTLENRAEERTLGAGLARALATLEVEGAQPWIANPRVTHLGMFATAAAAWRIPVPQAAAGYLFSWCENQVAAALRLVPLGQSAGLRIIAAAIGLIDTIAARGLTLPDDQIGARTPSHTLASALHETQYSRIFRS